MKESLKHFALLIFMLLLLSASFNVIAAEENDDLFYSQQKKTNSSNSDTAIKVPNNYHTLVLFDPSGFITFGPAIFIEPAIGKNLSVSGGIRFHNLGILQNAYFGKMKMSYMIHLSARYYVKPKRKIDGFFVGPGFEYGRSNYKSGNKYNARAFGGELGYKWVYKSGFCFEIADMVGLTQSKHIEESSGFPVNDNWTTDMFVYYMLSLKIGISF